MRRPDNKNRDGAMSQHFDCFAAQHDRRYSTPAVRSPPFINRTMYRVIEASIGEENPAGYRSAEPYIQTLSHRMIA
jgi:hypothetical protein